MQTFSFKTAKLTGRVTLEVDRRWVRAALNSKQTHIDFALVDTIHYWVTRSRGSILTGHFVMKDKRGRKLALQCSSFAQDDDFTEFLRAVAATLSAVGEVRPDVRVAVEPTPFHRCLAAGIILCAAAIAATAMYVFDTETGWTRIGGPVLGMLIAAGVVAFRFGLLRKKEPAMLPADVARQLAG
jgi:hypothetical protein